MKIETIISPIYDKDIAKHLDTSIMWNEAYHPDEELPTDKKLVEYRIKFEGTKPIQVLSIKEL